MDIEKIISTPILTALTPIIVFGLKFIFDYFLKGNERVKLKLDIINAIKATISENNWDSGHKVLVTEELFSNLYKTPISINEIKTLLSTKHPRRAFSTYLKHRSKIEISSSNKIIFKKNKYPYFSIRPLGFKIPKEYTFGFFSYIVFAYMSYYGFIFAFEQNSIIPKLYFGSIASVLGLFAVIFLINALKYQNSEKDLLWAAPDIYQAP